MVIQSFIAEAAVPHWVLTDDRARSLVMHHFPWDSAEAARRGGDQMSWLLMARYGIPIDQQVPAIHFVGYGYGLAQLGDWPVDTGYLLAPPPPPEARLQMLRESCCTHADVYEGVGKPEDILVGLIENEVDMELAEIALPLLELGYAIVPFRPLP